MRCAAAFVLGIYCIVFCLRRVFRLAFPCATLFVSSERAHVPRDASDLRLEGDTHHAKFFFLSSLVGSGEECPVWAMIRGWTIFISPYAVRGALQGRQSPNRDARTSDLGTVTHFGGGRTSSRVMDLIRTDSTNYCGIVSCVL